MDVLKNSKLLKHFCIFILICVAFRFIPPIGGMTPYGMAVLGIFVAMIYGWSVSPANMVWPSLLGMAALGLTDFGNCSAVMKAAFGSDVIILTFVGLLFASCLNSSKLTDYLANKFLTISFFAGKPWVMTAFFMIAPALLGIVVNGNIVLIMMLTIYGGIFKKCGYKVGDLYPAFLIVGTMFSMLMNMNWFPFMGWPLMVIAVAGGAGITFDPLPWMLTIIPTSFITSIGWILVMRLFPGVDASKLVAATEGMGATDKNLKMTSMQKFVLWAFIVQVAGFIVITFLSGTVGWRAEVAKFGIYGWILVITAFVMVIKIEGETVLDNMKMGNGFYFDTIFVMASAMCVSSALTAQGTGVSALMGQLLMPIFSMGEFWLIFFLTVVTFVLTNFLNNVAVTITITTVALSLYAQGVDFNIQIAMMLISTYGLMGIASPGGSAFAAMFHANEWTTTKSAYTAGLTAMGYILIIVAIVLIPLCLLLF